MQPVLAIIMPFRGERELKVALEALTTIDKNEIVWYRLPPLYESGIRYRREFCLAPGVPETCERWLSARQLYTEKFGDCDDIATYRAAELQLQGETAVAFPRRSPAGWHILVRRGDGSVEDPSKVLGMPG